MSFFRINSLIIDSHGKGVGKSTLSKMVDIVWYSLSDAKLGNSFQYLKCTT